MKTSKSANADSFLKAFSTKVTTTSQSRRSDNMKATAPAEIDLTQFVAKHYSTLWRYLRLIGCDASLAEDICQETFLYIMQKPLEHRNEKATLAYLRLTAKNRFIDDLRKRQRSIPYDLEFADQIWEEFNGDDFGESWIEALRECLKMLMGKQRLVIDLLYRDQTPLASIADTLGMKISGVKTLLGRTRKRLRDCVQRKVD